MLSRAGLILTVYLRMTSLDLLIFLPLLPECQNYLFVQPCLVNAGDEEQTLVFVNSREHSTN